MLDMIDEDNSELLVKHIMNIVPEFNPNNGCFGNVTKKTEPSKLIPEPLIN